VPESLLSPAAHLLVDDGRVLAIVDLALRGDRPDVEDAGEEAVEAVLLNGRPPASRSRWRKGLDFWRVTAKPRKLSLSGFCANQKYAEGPLQIFGSPDRTALEPFSGLCPVLVRRPHPGGCRSPGDPGGRHHHYERIAP
jgi:hypothetical protein